MPDEKAVESSSPETELSLKIPAQLWRPSFTANLQHGGHHLLRDYLDRTRRSMAGGRLISDIRSVILLPPVAIYVVFSVAEHLHVIYRPFAFQSPTSLLWGNRLYLKHEYHHRAPLFGPS